MSIQTNPIVVPKAPRTKGVDMPGLISLCTEVLSNGELAEQLPATVVKSLETGSYARRKKALMSVYYFRLNLARIAAKEAPIAAGFPDSVLEKLSKQVGKETPWADVQDQVDAIWGIKRAIEDTDQPFVSRGYSGKSARSSAKKRGVKAHQGK